MNNIKYDLELLTKTKSVDTTIFRVRILGTRECFNKSLKELYVPEYLNYLSGYNCGYLGFLYMSLNNSSKQSNEKTHHTTKGKFIPIISVLFTLFLILSNVAGTKISLLFGFNIASGLIFFPLTYILDDVITEV